MNGEIIQTNTYQLNFDRHPGEPPWKVTRDCNQSIDRYKSSKHWGIPPRFIFTFRIGEKNTHAQNAQRTTGKKPLHFLDQTINRTLSIIHPLSLSLLIRSSYSAYSSTDDIASLSRWKDSPTRQVGKTNSSLKDGLSNLLLPLLPKLPKNRIKKRWKICRMGMDMGV